VDGTGELHVKRNKASSKYQRSHFLSYMAELNVYIETYMIIYIYIYIYSYRKNKIVLMGLSKDTTEGRKEKENVRE
jgi:hypothetical protein